MDSAIHCESGIYAGKIFMEDSIETASPGLFNVALPKLGDQISRFIAA